MTAIGPGVRVKCIAAEWHNISEDDHSGPSLGSVWTVSEIEVAVELVWLELKEWPTDDVFEAPNFVPLDDDSVDLSALTAALNKGPLEPERDERVRVVERVR